MFIWGSAFTAHAQDEPITVAKKRISIAEVIQAIESQTKYSVAYTQNFFNTTVMISLSDTTVNLKEALDKITGDTHVNYIIQGRYIAIIPKFQATITVQEDEKPLPRTSDIYEKIDPEEADNRVASREIKPQIQEIQKTEPVNLPDTLVQYSDYTSVAGYGKIQVSLPSWAVKTNLLYAGATFTPNLSAEFAINRKSTLEVSFGWNPWERDKSDQENTKQLVHILVKPEFRWWLCERFNGHYFGAHLLYSRYQVSQYNIPLIFEKEHRYDGHAFGAGATYGYHLPLGKHWGVDFSIGIGGAYLKYDKYTCAGCDREGIKSEKFYFGPTRAGISLIYLIK